METVMNYKTLVAASLMSVALTSAAFAQCSDCALYPDRDVLNNGAPTPASKMMHPGTAGPRTANSEHGGSNARAEAGVADESVRTNVKGAQHRRYRDANASIVEGSAPSDSPAHQVYMKNLRDSGYNPAGDFNAAGNVKVN
jgi:hypothetical protein